MGLTGWIPVLYLGVFPTFIGYGIWFRALERIPAASAGAYIYASTLVAVIGGVEALGGRAALGPGGGGVTGVSRVGLQAALPKRTAGFARAPAEFRALVQRHHDHL